MIEPQAVQAAEFGTVAGAAGPAVMALRHDDAVAGMGVGNRGLDRQDAAMRCAEFDHGARQKVAILPEHRRHQRAAAARNQRESVRFVPVGNERRAGPEHLGVVHRLPRAVLDLEQRRRHESGFVAVDAGKRRHLQAAGDEIGFGGQPAKPIEGGILLRAGDQRAHARLLVARIANRGLAEPRGERFGHRIGLLRRHEDAADRGALLPRFHRHLARHFLDEGVEGGGRYGNARRQQRGIDAVGLDVHARAARQHVAVGADLVGGGRRAGEGDHVVGGHVVEQIADAATEQAERALRQHLRGDHVAHHLMAEPAGGGRRLCQHRHAGEQRAGGLFP